MSKFNIGDQVFISNMDRENVKDCPAKAGDRGVFLGVATDMVKVRITIYTWWFHPDSIELDKAPQRIAEKIGDINKSSADDAEEGDIVQLKSGGPLMTVTEKRGDCLFVVWFGSTCEILQTDKLTMRAVNKISQY